MYNLPSHMLLLRYNAFRVPLPPGRARSAAAASAPQKYNRSVWENNFFTLPLLDTNKESHAIRWGDRKNGRFCPCRHWKGHGTFCGEVSPGRRTDDSSVELQDTHSCPYVSDLSIILYNLISRKQAMLKNPHFRFLEPVLGDIGIPRPIEFDMSTADPSIWNVSSFECPPLFAYILAIRFSGYISGLFSHGHPATSVNGKWYESILSCSSMAFSGSLPCRIG